MKSAQLSMKEKSCKMALHLIVLLQHSMAAKEFKTAVNSFAFLSVFFTNAMPIKLMVNFLRFSFPAAVWLSVPLCVLFNA